MCTVTYISSGNAGFVFTSNRDEMPRRSPQLISREERFAQAVLFPRDQAEGGTWIAVSDRGRLVCLLNGADTTRRSRSEYRMSRGLMALKIFEYDDCRAFLEGFTFEGMEAFTMIIVEENALVDVRWDESQLKTTGLDPNRSYIWSSVKLYTPAKRKLREQWFNNWLTDTIGTPRWGQVLNFHYHSGVGDPGNDLIMHRPNGLRTTSVSSIRRDQDRISFYYHDLISDQRDNQTLEMHING